MDTEYSVYFGQEQKNGFTGFLAEKHFFCVAEIFDGYTQERGEQLMAHLAHLFDFDAPENLTSFDTAISEVIKKANVPLDTSLAVGYVKNTILYLKTIGSGEVILKRGKAFETLIKGTNIASGKIHGSDIFVFTTNFFTEALKGFTLVKGVLEKRQRVEVLPDALKERLGPEDDTGAIALFVLIKETAEKASTEKEKNKAGFQYTNLIFSVTQFLKNNKKRAMVVLLVFLLFFGWNITRVMKERGVQLGGRSRFDQLQLSIRNTLERIEGQKENRSENLRLLQEAQQTLQMLKQRAGNKDQTTISNLESAIEKTSAAVVNREAKTAQDFYDLSVEEKTAKGIKTALFEDSLAVLNPEGKVYLLSLEKKSITQRKLSSKVSEKALVSLYEKKAFVYDPEIGIEAVDQDNKPKTVIKPDAAWGAISQMIVYNANIYLLDVDGGDIIKYLSIGDTFGDKMSYFKGSYDVIDTSSSFSINTAIYVATKKTISKYVSGVKEEIKNELPGEEAEITKLITYKDAGSIYGWDKKNGLIYLFSQEGEYKKQIANSILKTANDVEVYNNAAYLLSGNMIKIISLD